MTQLSHASGCERKRFYLYLFILCLVMPNMVYAAGGNPIENGVDWVMTLLTSGIARSAAIIGCAGLGFLAWAGRITAEMCLKFVMGIVLVFGGATIVDLISSAVG
jgi:type IV secretion system protein VirB2